MKNYEVSLKITDIEHEQITAKANSIEEAIELAKKDIKFQYPNAKIEVVEVQEDFFG